MISATANATKSTISITISITTITSTTLITRTMITRRNLELIIMIAIRIISDAGSRIPEPLLCVTSMCPLRVQISQGLGTFFQIELLKASRRCSLPPLSVRAT